MDGLRVQKNKRNGFTVAFLHYTADPARRTEEYKAMIKQGLSEREYRREHELDFSSLEGARVFNEFMDKQVCRLEFIPGRPFYTGTDWGFLQPAHVLTQINPDDQWLWHREFRGKELHVTTFLEIICWLEGRMSDEMLSDDTMEEIIKYKLTPWFEYPCKERFVDYCDSAGDIRTDKGKQSNINIAQQAPFYRRMRFKKTPIEAGINLMAMRMRKRPKDGKFGTLIDDRCTLTIEGLQGGFERNTRGDIPDGPYTDIFDAYRYILVNLTNERLEQNIYQGKKEFWNKFIKARTKPNYANSGLPYIARF